MSFRIRYIFITLSAVLLLTFFSCNDHIVYYKYVSTSLSGWDKNDTISFYLPKTKISGHYSMDLGLRINDSYPFTSLTLIIQKTYFPSMTISSDTIRCRLRDEKGVPRRRGVSYYQYTFPIAELKLQYDDSIQVTVRHDMKREMLPGIGDIGIVMKQH